jgi:Vanadium chloroperoxidase N-terminal domain
VDPILFWNDIANEANRRTHTTAPAAEAGSRGPCGSSRAYAIVHLAMHDAYFAVNTGIHDTWIDAAALPTPPAGADVDVAVAGAAHAALSALYPTQTAEFDAKLAEAGIATGGPTGPAYVFGAAVAAKVLAERAGDPSLDDTGHAASDAPGRHRHDPDAPADEHGFHAPFYGARAKCFAVGYRYKLDGPPKLDEPDYLAALREVKAKGIAPELTATLPSGSDTRAADETTIGIFWAYDGAKGLGTPPRLYNQIVRQIADAQGNTPAQNARLFALVNAAMADAGILAWDDKYDYDLWRPVLGIREHGDSLGPEATPGNPLDADADPFWLPLGAPRTNEPGKNNFTPPFPAYPSGHATFGAAAFQSVRKFYNAACDYEPDDLTADIGFVSDELNGINRDNHGTVRPKHSREFPGGLWQMIEENGRSRIYLGVHWVFDAFAVDENGEMDLTENIGGVRLGLDIADDIATGGFKAADAAGPRLP